MNSNTKSGLFWSAAVLLFSFCLFFSSAAEASGHILDDEIASGGPPLRILVVSSFHLTHKWTSEVNTQLEFGIEGYTPYIEYLGMNSIRGRSGNYKEKFKSFLPLIQQHRFDIVISLLFDATNLVIENLEAIPADVPVITCGYRKITKEITDRHPNITGLNIAFNIVDTIEKGLRIIPDTEEILVVSDDMEGSVEATLVAQEYAKNFDRCKISFCSGVNNTTQQMLEQIYQLPNNSFVIFAPWRNYAKDGFISLRAIGNEIKKSEVPYFVLTDVLFGKGALGGLIAHGPHDGKILAQLVKSVADNKSAEWIPFRFDECKFSVDMKVFNEYELNRKLLPTGTILINDDESHCRFHLMSFVGLISGLIVLAVLILLFCIYHLYYRGKVNKKDDEQRDFISDLTVEKNNRTLLQDILERIVLGQENIRDICDDLVAEFGKSMGAECIVYLKFRNDEHVDTVFEWLADDISSIKEKIHNFDMREIPVIRQALLEKGAWYMENEGDIRGDYVTSEKLKSLGIKAAAFQIIREAGSPVGIAGMCFITATHSFTDNERTMMKNLGETIELARNLEKRRDTQIINEISLKNQVDNEKLVDSFLSKLIADDNSISDIELVLLHLKNTMKCRTVCFGTYSHEDIFHIEKRAKGDTEHFLEENEFLVEQFKRWHREFKAAKSIVIPDITAFHCSDVFGKSGCKAVMCIPVQVDDRLAGVVVLGFASSDDMSAEGDGSMLRSISRVVALSINHLTRSSVLENAMSDRNTSFCELKIPLMQFDNKGNLTAFNDEFVNLLAGVSEEEIKSTPCNKLFCKKESRPDWCPIYRAINTRKTIHEEMRIGDKQWLLTATPVLDTDGNITSVVESALDITEASETRRRLEKALNDERNAAKAQSNFLAAMSHEIRTPLNSVIAFTELLQDSALTEDKRNDYLRIVGLAGNTLLNLINDILDLSKLEAGKMPVFLSHCEPDKLVSGICAMLEVKARKKGISLLVEVQENMPALMLDAARVSQILLNLLSNAVKFTDQGAVTVSVDFKLNGDNKGCFTVKVKDTGIGIPETVIPRIFDQYYQNETVRDARAFKGTGLGLPISAKLAEIMRGKIHVESKVGSGSTFTLVLDNVTVSNEVNNTTANTEQATATSFKYRPTIMLVDDVPLNLKVLSALLDKAGADSICAASGEEALNIMKTKRPDAVFTDMWMPGMDGDELARKILLTPELRKVPVFAVTADAEAQYNFDVTCFKGILIKPVTQAKISKALADI